MCFGRKLCFFTSKVCPCISYSYFLFLIAVLWFRNVSRKWTWIDGTSYFNGNFFMMMESSSSRRKFPWSKSRAKVHQPPAPFSAALPLNPHSPLTGASDEVASRLLTYRCTVNLLTTSCIAEQCGKFPSLIRGRRCLPVTNMLGEYRWIMRDEVERQRLLIGRSTFGATNVYQLGCLWIVLASLNSCVISQSEAFQSIKLLNFCQMLSTLLNCYWAGGGSCCVLDYFSCVSIFDFLSGPKTFPVTRLLLCWSGSDRDCLV